jgi:hypothetical protein
LGSLKLPLSTEPLVSSPEPLLSPQDLKNLEDIGYMTCMTLTMLGNYAQTGHFGGPLAYTPYNVAVHLAGPDLGGLRYDYRRPKHPYGDRFLMAAGHSVPTCYALWMILGQALARRFEATGDRRYYVDPQIAMLPIDALGFRRGAGALATLLADAGLAGHPLFAQAKTRGIRALSGHAEATDLTNDVNGGPSGVGIASAGFLGLCRRPQPQLAQDLRAGRRVRAHRGPRPGVQDAGAGAAGGQAAARAALR